MANQNVCAGANSEVFEEYWPKVAPRLRAYILLSVGSHHDADDVLQETAVAIARSMDRYDPERPFLAWALGFARLRLLAYFRGRARHRAVALSSDRLEKLETAFLQVDEEASGWRDQLQACIEKLPARSRRLLELRYSEGHSTQEIADMTGLTVASVYARLSQIRLGLRSCLARKKNRGDASGSAH